MLARLAPLARGPAEDGTTPSQRLAAFDPAQRDRALMTIGCRDCDDVPKVRGAGRLFDTPTGRVQLMHCGVRVEADAYNGPWMTEIIRQLRGHHEPQEEFAFHTILKHARPGSTVVELGCCWSYYALWFLNAVRRGRAVLVEPNACGFALGQRHFAMNGRVGRFTRASVGAAPLAPRVFSSEAWSTEEAIPEISVDSLLAAENTARVEVLLADIQGAELAMLHGAAESIRAGKVRFAVISTHHVSISGDSATHVKCLAEVERLGGHVLVEHGVDESFSGDGLIVASFDPADRTLPRIPVSRNAPDRSLFGRAA